MQRRDSARRGARARTALTLLPASQAGSAGVVVLVGKDIAAG